MLKKKFFFLKIFLLLCVISSFILGFLFHQKKFFPYYQLKFFFKEITQSKDTKKATETIKVNNKDQKILDKYFLFEDLLISEKTYNTHTLPIQIIKYNLNKIEKKIYEKGGLCLAGERILIFYNNSFFFSDDKKLSRLNTNFLPKNSIVTSLNCSEEKENVVNFFFNVVESYSDKKFYNKIFRGNLNLLTKEINVKLINSLETNSKNGAGKILFYNSDQLFLSLSAPNTNKNSAQDLKDLGGKIISIDLKTNDFIIHTLGHRNPQGLFIDDNNNFFATEHGPYGGDELNLISKDKNYGWPITSDGLESRDTYEKSYGSLGRHSSEFEKPIYSWTPGIGISDLLRVKSFDKTWDNDLLVTSLKNKSLYRIRLDFFNDNFAVKYIEDIWIGHRIRHIRESADKKIVLLTDDGFLIKIFKINKGDDKWVDTRSNACLSCHHLGVTNQTHAAPSLVGIFNRNAGSDPNYEYSNAFDDKKFLWNENNMIEYLLDPQKFLPGTTKPYKAANLKEASKAVEDLKRIAITLK